MTRKELSRLQSIANDRLMSRRYVQEHLPGTQTLELAMIEYKVAVANVNAAILEWAAQGCREACACMDPGAPGTHSLRSCDDGKAVVTNNFVPAPSDRYAEGWRDGVEAAAKECVIEKHPYPSMPGQASALMDARHRIRSLSPSEPSPSAAPRPGSEEAKKTESCRCGRPTWRDSHQWEGGTFLRCLGCDRRLGGCKCDPVSPSPSAAPTTKDEEDLT